MRSIWRGGCSTSHHWLTHCISFVRPKLLVVMRVQLLTRPMNCSRYLKTMVYLRPAPLLWFTLAGLSVRPAMSLAASEGLRTASRCLIASEYGAIYALQFAFWQKPILWPDNMKKAWSRRAWRSRHRQRLGIAGACL